MVQPGFILVCLGIASVLPPAFGAVDNGHFAVPLPYSDVGIPPFVNFSTPSNGAASYIMSAEEVTPPYAVKTTLAPSSLECDMTYATPCSIQAAIDIVSRGREELCNMFTADMLGPDLTLDVLMIGFNMDLELAGSIDNFDFFVLDENFNIVADWPRSDLYGLPFDGLAASGHSVQPRFRERVRWVVGNASGSTNTGGFVPHATTRFTPSSSGTATPVSVSSYFEMCLTSSSVYYVGASVRRRAQPAEEACDPAYNDACNIFNMQRMVGLALLDFLSLKDEDDYQKFVLELGYGETYSVGSVTPLLAQVGVYPGMPDQLNPTLNTILASKSVPSQVGDTTTAVYQHLGPAAVQGGGWLKFPVISFNIITGAFPILVRTSTYQANLVAGVVFGDTAHVISASFTHAPPNLTEDFECSACNASFQPCAFQTLQYLSSHGLSDFLLADNSSDAFSRMTNLKWLGADHASSKTAIIDEVELNDHWPSNFTLAVFTTDGLCVADGADPSMVGSPFGQRTGEQMFMPTPYGSTWENLTAAVAKGIGFIEYNDTRFGMMFAKVTKMRGFDSEFYMVSAIPITTPDLGECEFDAVDPCVGAWIEAKMMEWIALLALSAPEMWGVGADMLAMMFPVGEALWADVYDADWSSMVQSGYAAAPELTASDIEALDAVSSSRGGWVSMPNTTTEHPHKAFVLSFRYNASLEVRVVAGFVGSLGNVSCDGGCGDNQYCDDYGSCQCMEGVQLIQRYMDRTCSNGFGKTVLECEILWDPVPVCEDMDDLEECNLCTAGNYCPNNYVSYECPEGYYCPALSRSPLPCPGGTWTASVGASNVTDCFSCDAGTYRDPSALTTCQICPAGSYTNETGKSSCTRCPVGFWQNSTGSSGCYRCRDDMTTDGTGYTSEEGCACPANTYAVLGDDNETSCQSCGEGSTCRGFGHEPQALEGYYLYEVERSGLSVFKCSDATFCPGGALQSCAAGRTGIACADCMDDMTPDVDGSCRDCVFADKLWLWAATLLFAAALAILYYRVSNADRSKQNHATLLAAICASQSVTLAQTLNVLATLQVEWRKPLSSFLAAFKFLSFDISEMRVSCHITANARDSYILRLMVPIAALVFVTLLHVLATAAWYSSQFGARLPVFLGAVGSIFNAFCISVVLASLQPLQCVQHPNGFWTIYEAMSELCWEGSRHTSMVIAAAFACIVPILFLVSVVYILQSFPQKMREGDVRFLNTAQFLLFRYKPATRWCALFLICRNMLVAVIPAVPDPVYQVILLQFISLVGLFVVLQYKPCRVVFANVSEVGICLLSLIAGSTAAFFLEDAELDIISQLAMGVILAITILFPAGIVVGIIHWVRQSKKKTFHFFLCHHKAGAGALARLLKMELCRGGGSLQGDVFIDSDNLDNLDKLFNFVAQETDTLVAISSAELYKRPWCVGEVTTAHAQQLRVVPLYLIDFSPLTDDFIQDISDVVDLQCVFEQGIALDSIQAALRWARSLGGLTMPPSTDVRILGELAKALFYRSTLSGSDALLLHAVVGVESMHSSSHQNSSGTGTGSLNRTLENKPPVAIVVDSANTEAMCSARILIDLLCSRFGDAVQAPALLQEATANPSKSLDLLPSVQRLAMICTVNCWSSLEFLTDAVHGYWTGLEMHPVVVDEGYRYPTEAFYVDLENFGQRVCRACDVPENPAALRSLVAMVFKNIASHFHVLGSMDLLNTQAAGIARRLHGHRTSTARQAQENETNEDVRSWCAQFVRSACTWSNANVQAGPGATKRKRLSEAVVPSGVAIAAAASMPTQGGKPEVAERNADATTGEESFDVDSFQPPHSRPLASI